MAIAPSGPDLGSLSYSNRITVKFCSFRAFRDLKRYKSIAREHKVTWPNFLSADVKGLPDSTAGLRCAALRHYGLYYNKNCWPMPVLQTARRRRWRSWPDGQDADTFNSDGSIKVACFVPPTVSNENAPATTLPRTGRNG